MNDRVVETQFVFDRRAATDMSVAYAILVPPRRPACGPARRDNPSMTSTMSSSMTGAAIYARVSSARQNKDQTIGSQTAALRARRATGA